jgi:hypothetical protein
MSCEKPFVFSSNQWYNKFVRWLGLIIRLFICRKFVVDENDNKYLFIYPIEV